MDFAAKKINTLKFFNLNAPLVQIYGMRAAMQMVKLAFRFNRENKTNRTWFAFSDVGDIVRPEPHIKKVNF